MSVVTMDIVENLWTQYATNLNHGFVNKIVVDPMVAHAIGKAGLALLAERYEYVIATSLKRTYTHEF